MKLGEIAEIKTGLVLTRKKAKLESETWQSINWFRYIMLMKMACLMKSPVKFFEVSRSWTRSILPKKGIYSFG